MDAKTQNQNEKNTSTYYLHALGGKCNLISPVNMFLID